jgi:sortase A
MTAAAPPAAPPPKRRSRARRLLRGLSTLLIVLGVLVLVDAGVTLLWQEPLSALYAHQRQNSLAHDLDRLEHRPLASADRAAIARLQDADRRLAYLARSFRRGLEDGQAIGRIRIPTIGVDKVMVQGTGESELMNGPGHYPATPLPGERGTVGVAGHRTTYGAPFRHLDGVHAGDRIELRMPYGTFVYRSVRTRIVPSDALWITRRVGFDELVLSACHPLYSATHRIVVFARLVSESPRG